MYERKIKKGPRKGRRGWGCPLCFTMLPEHKSETGKIFNIIKEIYIIETIEELEELEEEKPFDFWKKPRKKKPKKDDNDDEKIE